MSSQELEHWKSNLVLSPALWMKIQVIGQNKVGLNIEIYVWKPKLNYFKGVEFEIITN
jgi:hypothetical protein